MNSIDLTGKKTTGVNALLKRGFYELPRHSISDSEVMQDWRENTKSNLTREKSQFVSGSS